MKKVNFSSGNQNFQVEDYDVKKYITTLEFDVAGKVGLNKEGGIMVKLINNTGSPSVKGNCVFINAVNSVGLTLQNQPDCIGVFYENNVANGSLAWVVISGIADVYFIDSTTAGQLARTFVTADGDFVIGQAKAENVPSSPFATDKHFCEIGHVLETRNGAGLAKCVLHFN